MLIFRQCYSISVNHSFLWKICLLFRIIKKLIGKYFCLKMSNKDEKELTTWLLFYFYRTKRSKYRKFHSPSFDECSSAVSSAKEYFEPLQVFVVSVEFVERLWGVSAIWFLVEAVDIVSKTVEAYRIGEGKRSEDKEEKVHFSCFSASLNESVFADCFLLSWLWVLMQHDYDGRSALVPTLRF